MRRLLGSITSVRTKEPVAALTFDDGPNPIYTPLLLDLLKRHDAYGTFFMVGKTAGEHKDIVESVAQAGHAIGNHTQDHASLPKLTSSQRRAQIKQCQQAIAPFGSALLRPPWGHQSYLSRIDAFLLGYKIIMWDVGVQDWLDNSPEWTAAQLTQKTKPGSIILLHDSIQHSKRFCPQIDASLLEFSREKMLGSLDIFLENMKGKMQFITVPDLLQRGTPQKRHWLRYP